MTKERMRLVEAFPNAMARYRVEIRYSHNWNEYEVMPIAAGIKKVDAAYYTSERADAIETMSAMYREMMAN